MIAAVVLAAGESRRMRVQKLLLPFGDTTVIRHIVRQVQASSVDGVYVVTGHTSSKVGAQLEMMDVSLVHNALFRQGMLSSVRAGWARVPDAATGVMIVLGDQPLIEPALIDRLVESFDEDPERIVVPTFGGRRGHPVVLPMRFREEVMTSFDEIGLRGLLKSHADAVRLVPTDTRTVLSDMDYPEDYRLALEALERQTGRRNDE